MAWAPEAIYNPVKDNYLVYWSARTTVDGNTRDRLYCNETEDFVHFGETKLAEQEPFFENWKIKKRPNLTMTVMATLIHLSSGWQMRMGILMARCSVW